MKRLIAVLTLAVILAGCGASDLIRSFRVALAASPALVASLVESGAIKQADATAITADFTDAVQCADTLQLDFKAIAKDDPNAKPKKLSASVKGLRCFRVITQRRNFEKNPKVKNAADLAEGILATLVVFYSEPGVMINSTTVRAVKAADEKELNKTLKDQIDELEKALKP